MSKNKHIGQPTKTDREDYDRYMMGQVKIIHLMKLRNKPESYYHRIFNFLLHEKMAPYQKFKPTQNENTTHLPARMG
jgi:hypothetical protein